MMMMLLHSRQHLLRAFRCQEHTTEQLGAQGTTEHSRLGWPFFVREIFILKILGAAGQKWGPLVV
jgi:hypothetical protein